MSNDRSLANDRDVVAPALLTHLMRARAGSAASAQKNHCDLGYDRPTRLAGSSAPNASVGLAGTNRNRVISEGTPKRLGGPQ